MSVYEKAQGTNENLEMAQDELNTLKSRGDLLEDKISSLGTPKGIETEIRDKFSVVKEGEEVIVIIKEEFDIKEQNNKKGKSFWEVIKGLFR